MNYSLSVQVGRVIAFAEFWVFVFLRETHVIGWSWWWLVAFQAMSAVSLLADYRRAEPSKR